VKEIEEIDKEEELQGSEEIDKEEEFSSCLCL
jgi:hypothetical protein